MQTNVSKNITKIPFLFLLKRIYFLKKRLLREIEHLHGIFGDVYCIQADNLNIFIRRPDLIKSVLLDNHLAYEKGNGFKLFHNVVGFGLLTSDGQKWQKERKVLNFEFTRQNQDLNHSIIQNELENLKTSWEKQNKINFTEDMNELLIHTICKILFNYDFKGDTKKVRQWFHDYDNYIGKQQKSFNRLPMWFPLPYLYKAKKAIVGLRSFAKDVMNHCLDSEKPSMIKRMREAGFDQETICDHILTFFIAGHETTANSLNFTMMLLRDNPKYINYLKSEINDLEEANRENIGELKYLDLIIKESLRLYPTIPLFPRIAKDDCELGEFSVKKGTMIAFSPWIMHRTEKYWKDAQTFYPERFIDQKFEKDFIYFPFGLGPRKCIGAQISMIQMKAIIYFIFKNFDLDIKGPNINNFRHNVSLSPKKDVYLYKK